MSTPEAEISVENVRSIDKAASIANSMAIEGHVLSPATLSQAIEAFQTELDQGEFEERKADAIAFCRRSE